MVHGLTAHNTPLWAATGETGNQEPTAKLLVPAGNCVLQFPADLSG